MQKNTLQRPHCTVLGIASCSACLLSFLFGFYSQRQVAHYGLKRLAPNSIPGFSAGVGFVESLSLDAFVWFFVFLYSQYGIHLNWLAFRVRATGNGSENTLPHPEPGCCLVAASDFLFLITAQMMGGLLRRVRSKMSFVIFRSHLKENLLVWQ